MLLRLYSLLAFSQCIYAVHARSISMCVHECDGKPVPMILFFFTLYTHGCESSFNVMFIALQNSLFLYIRICMRARVYSVCAMFVSGGDLTGKCWVNERLKTEIQIDGNKRDRDRAQRELIWTRAYYVRVLNTCVFDVILLALCALSDYIAAAAVVVAAVAAHTHAYIHLNFFFKKRTKNEEKNNKTKTKFCSDATSADVAAAAFLFPLSHFPSLFALCFNLSEWRWVSERASE